MPRDVFRITNDGVAWVDDGQGGEIPFQLVMADSGSLGLRKIEDQRQAIGVDQHALHPPQLPSPEKKRVSKKDNHFDISGIDQA